MRSNALIAFITSAVLLLAGCAGEDTETPDGGDTTGAGADGNETADPGSGDAGDEEQDDSGSDGEENATNTPPEASLDASAVNGTAPLNVTFTLDGSDADGDGLTWFLAVEGESIANGTELPATVIHNFTAAGNFSVGLTVDDGMNTSVAQTLIVVQAATAAEPVLEVTGTWVGGDDGLGGFAESYLCEPGPNDGVLYSYFENPAEAHGLPFRAEITDAADGAAILNWGITFWDIDDGCFTGQTWSSGSTADGELNGAVPIEGVLPEFEFAYFWADGGASLEATLVA